MKKEHQLGFFGGCFCLLYPPHVRILTACPNRWQRQDQTRQATLLARQALTLRRQLGGEEGKKRLASNLKQNLTHEPHVHVSKSRSYWSYQLGKCFLCFTMLDSRWWFCFFFLPFFTPVKQGYLLSQVFTTGVSVVMRWTTM